MRALPKHLRPRWRYLGVAVETWPEVAIDRRAFQRAIWDAARGLLGDPGSADCDLTVMRFRFEEAIGRGEAIVRVRREERTRGRAALACVDSVSGHPVGLAVRGTSGTIRACERYLTHCAEPNGETTVRLSGVERPAVRGRAGRLDVRTDEGFVGATELDVDVETEPSDGESENE